MNKRARTHELIKESILIILSKKTLSHITVNDICDKSNITRSTFYTHYKDKYHVLETINEDICSQLDQHLSARFSVSDIELILISLINDIDKEKFLIMMAIQDETVNLRRDIQETINRSAYKYFKAISANKTCDVSIDFMAKLFSSIAISFVEYSIEQGETEQNAIFLNNLNKIIIDDYIKSKTY